MVQIAQDAATSGDGVSLTSSASAEAKRLRETQPLWSGMPLRLYIEGKGCDGFVYGVTFDMMEQEDLSFTVDGISVVIDPDTYKFVKGSTIDWVDDERGQGFLVTNPQHKNFRGKFFKRKGWEDRLLSGAQS